MTGKLGSLQVPVVYIHQRLTMTQIKALFCALSTYVGLIFQSQLSSVGPDKSNDSRFSNVQGDFGSRIEQNSICEGAELVPLFI